jgi:uncharacterized protein
MAKQAPALTEAELDRLADMLARHEEAMSLEMLDGFLAALVCGPETVLPSDYIPEVLGGEMSDEVAFDSEDEVKDFFDLLMCHWNHIAGTLHSGEVYVPLLLGDENGIAHGNDWAHGFYHGTRMRHEAWRELFNDEEHVGALVPILALHYEHDEDPELRPYQEPVSEERRLDLLGGAAAGLKHIYQYFAPHRRGEARAARASKTFRRETPKPGRNDPCSCGSGRKYKHCCGRAG